MIRAGALFLFLSSSIFAATLYTSRSSFLSAANVTQTITFEGIAPPGGQNTYPGTVTVGGVVFTSSGGGAFPAINDSAFGPTTVDGTDDLEGGEACSFPFCGTLFGGTLTLTLPAGTTQLGVDFAGQIVTGGLLYSTLLSTGDTTSGTLGPGLFIGYISNTPITSLSFSTFPQNVDAEADGFVIVDNVTLGSDAPIPEPATAATLLSGGLLLAWGSTRKRR